MTSPLLLTLLLAAQTELIALDGQSLSEGLSTGGALSTTQSLGNKMVGSLTMNGTTYALEVAPPAWPLANLVEFGSIESPRSGMANYYATATGRAVLVVTGSQTASAYTVIKKGTLPWRNLERSVESFGARGRANVAIGMAWMHGESDHAASTSLAAYGADLVEVQGDFDDEVQASTCNSAAAPLYVQQFSSWSAAAIQNGKTYSDVVQAMYATAKLYPGTIIITGANYPWSHAADGVHLTAASSRAVGAMIGKAIAYGPTWQPTWPTSVTRVGAVITVNFHVPVPPLVLDDVNVTDPGSYGFSYYDDNSPPAISSVVLADADTVTITLASEPTGNNKSIRYAYSATIPSNGGPTTGPRGCLRDSDTATWQGANLYNWAVHFHEAVP